MNRQFFYPRSVIAAVALALCLVFATESLADQIVLENGDILTGTIEKAVDGKITLKTDYSSPIEIQASKIRKMYTTNPVEVHLRNGEILKGTLTTSDDGMIVVERAEKEKTSFDVKRMASINPPPTKWTGGLTIAGSSQSGNTKRDSATVGFDATRRTKEDRFALHYLLNYAEERNEVAARNHYGQIKYDYFFTQKMYGTLGVEFLNDHFRDIKLRTVVGPGIGYQVWEDPDKSLAFEVGISYVDENRYKAEDDDYFAARLGANFKYRLFDSVYFTDQLVVYPRLDEGGEYLLHNEAYLTAPLVAGWALKFGNILDKDSSAPPGRRQHDSTWMLGLQYAF